MQKMRNDLLSKTATLSTVAFFFFALALCSGQLSASAGPEPSSYASRLSTNGEQRAGQAPAYSPKQQGSGDTLASQEGSTVKAEKAAEITSVERRRRPSGSVSRSRAGSLRRTSGARSKLLAAATAVTAVIFLLWRLGNILWKCLSQTGTRAGATPRSLSGSEDERQKDVCVELEVSSSASSDVEGRRRVQLEPLAVTVVTVGLVLAGFAFFIYTAVTSQTPTTEPLSGPGRYGTQVFTGLILLAVGAFSFYMYLTVQRQTAGPRLPGSPDQYVAFFLYWGMIFVMSAVCSFLSAGGPESYVLPAVAAFVALLFIHTYWKNLRTLPPRPPREDYDKDEDSDKGIDNPPFTISGTMV